jgi:hypothetical protein
MGPRSREADIGSSTDLLQGITNIYAIFLFHFVRNYHLLPTMVRVIDKYHQ